MVDVFRLGMYQPGRCGALVRAACSPLWATGPSRDRGVRPQAPGAAAERQSELLMEG